MVSRFALRIIIAAHFGCNDLLGFVVDDSNLNSPLSALTSHMIRKNWHVPVRLYAIRLLYRPWLLAGEYQSGTLSMSPRSCSIS